MVCRRTGSGRQRDQIKNRLIGLANRHEDKTGNATRWVGFVAWTLWNRRSVREKY